MMAPLPVEKLAKLIPLLASDHDGEVVSAARAISRALKAATCDFHDIVKALGTSPQPNSAYARQRADMARTGAFYSSPFEDAMREFRNANSEFFREAGEADRMYAEAQAAAERQRDTRGADAPEIKRLADTLLGSSKQLSANEARFVRLMKINAQRDPAYTFTPAERERWNGIVGRAL